MGILWSLEQVDRRSAGRHTGAAPTSCFDCGSDSVERHREVKTEFCPDVAGFCPGVAWILSLSDRSLSWSALNMMGGTFRMCSDCSRENLVKSGTDSGVVASVVSCVPVHAELPRARARREEHTLRRASIKGSFFSSQQEHCLKAQRGSLCSRIRSEPEPFVGQSDEGLAVDETANVLQQRFQVSFGDTCRSGCDVRCDDHVLHLPEGMVCGQGFDFEDIQAGAGDVAFLQCDGQVLQIDDGAAADVDQVAGVLHQLELGRAEQFFCLGSMRRCDDDEVADGEQVFESIEVPDFIDGAGNFTDEGIDGTDPHAEGGCAVADFGTNRAGTDHTQGAVRKVHVAAVDFADLSRSGDEVRFSGGTADGLPDRMGLLANVTMQVAGEAEHEAEHMVGDDIVEQATHVCELAGVVGQFGKNVVFQAGSGGLHPFQFFSRGQQFGSDLTEEGVGVSDFGERCIQILSVDDFELVRNALEAGESSGVDGGIDEKFFHGESDSLKVFDGAADNAFAAGLGLQDQITFVVDFEAGAFPDFASGIDANVPAGEQAVLSPGGHEFAAVSRDIVEPVFDGVDEIDQRGGERELLSGRFVKRGSSRLQFGFSGEERVIEIDADADDHEAGLTGGGFDENSADLFACEEDIVGPFQLEAMCGGLFLECFTNGQAGRQRNQGLLLERDAEQAGVDNEGECESSFSGPPDIVASTTAGGLIAGEYEGGQAGIAGGRGGCAVRIQGPGIGGSEALEIIEVFDERFRSNSFQILGSERQHSQLISRQEIEQLRRGSDSGNRFVPGIEQRPEAADFDALENILHVLAGITEDGLTAGLPGPLQEADQRADDNRIEIVDAGEVNDDIFDLGSVKKPEYLVGFDLNVAVLELQGRSEGSDYQIRGNLFNIEDFQIFYHQRVSVVHCFQEILKETI